MRTILRAASAIAATLCFGAALPAGAQNTTFDVHVNLDDADINGYFVASYSPAGANVAPTGGANLNPVLRLEVGKRYKFTYVNASGHPFELIGKDAGFNHTIVLSRGGAGTMESDPGVAWVEDQPSAPNDFYFTLTPALASALAAGGKTPAYQCQVHGASMANNLNIVQSSVEGWRDYSAGK